MAGRSGGIDAGGGVDSGAGHSDFVPDVEVELRAVQKRVQVLAGATTEIWTLEGTVTRGPASTLVNIERGALGPTLHVERGQKIRIGLENQLQESTILHWHGLHVAAPMDGHPRSAIAPGQRYVYEFEIRNQAGTYLYHAHPHQRTGPQVYQGMAGLFIVHDAAEDALALPRDEFDVLLAIQDRLFDSNNQLVYEAASVHATGGWLGDRVLINGAPEFALHAATRAYRVRLVNASNSRVYRLAWQDGTPLTVIGTDGGLLEAPVQRAYVMLGPGERVELWADFSGRSIGSDLALVSLPFDAGMGVGIASAGLPQGAAMPVLTVKFDRQGADQLVLPDKLVASEHYREGDAVNANAPRRVVIAMQHMTWTLNGRTYQLDQIADDEHVKLGTLELWEFENPSATGGMGMHGGMGMMQAPHPMHVHGGQFRVLSRTGVTHTGYVDDGWKDTVLLMPGETARIAMRFDDYVGEYLYHCHNLEHEDLGMMRNFDVRA